MAPTPVPANAYVELNTDLIDEGGLRQELDQRLGQAFRQLLERESATGDKTAKAVISCRITIERGKDSEQFWRITHSVNHAVPPIDKTSLVRGAGGRLICQPEGSSDDDPDQMHLFDAQGQPRGTLNTETGEIEQPSGVAGKLGG